jgi:hypothetical protein
MAHQLASSEHRRLLEKTKRQSLCLSVKQTLAREYLVAKRLTGAQRGWAQSWARLHHADLFSGSHELQVFLQNVRRYARGVGKHLSVRGEDTASLASSQALRQTGGPLGVASCGGTLPASKRRRRHGAGGPGVMKCPEIGAELFAWFVDSVRNIKGRVPSSLLLHVAMVISKDLLHFHEQQKEFGLVAPHVELALPVLDHGWL